MTRLVLPIWLRANAAVRCLMAGVLLAAPLHAAELHVDDGVVIKFGEGAGLVVRDRVVMGSGVTLTSVRDDSVGGRTGATEQTPGVGDWRGLRLEKSAAATGALTLNDVAVRYASASDGSDAAGLTVRGWSPSLNSVQFISNGVGLRLLDGANPAIQGANFLGNATGLEASGNSAPVIQQTQFVGNSAFAISNLTPTTVIRATGNWWGHPSGPLEPDANPQGQGDKISTGVDFGGYLVSAPLLNPSVRLTAPAAYYEQRTVQLELSCGNASEFRIAEGTGFAGVPFQPLANGRAQVPFTLSEGDGRKQISVQYRNASGTVVVAQLTGGVLIDTLAPAVSLTNPAPGSVISQPITVEAQASDASGISQVRFFIDDALMATRTGTPYSYTWNTENSADGPHAVKVIATDGVGRSGEQTVEVTLSRVPTAPDTSGPTLGAIQFNGTALADGFTLTRTGNVAISATDPSGVARVELLIDGAVVTGATGSAGGYSTTLNLDAVGNGAHTLTIRAVDSLGNVSSKSYAVTVTHAAPPAPLLSQPANGLTTRTAAIVVLGTAQPGSTVQLMLNGVVTGAPLVAGGDGRFSGGLTLAPGANTIQATTTDTYGTSIPSTALMVTLDVTVPAGPGSLAAQAQTAGKVRLTWTKSTDPNVTGYHLYRATGPFTSVGEAVKITGSALAVTSTSYDDLPPQDGIWTYRAVSVNAAGTLSDPSNAAQVTSDGTAPKALSIAYTSLGKTDPATGRIGQGRVNVVLTTNEALQSMPYLSVVPHGGTPITVELTNSGDTSYTGAFLVDSNTPSGVANALFSARDMVGNRGTEIDAGATLKIDTEGPVLSGIVLAPAAPIKNDPAQTVQGTFTFSKAPTVAPQLKYLLSGPVRTAVPLDGLTQTNATTYVGSFALPTDAGLGSPESLSFSQQAKDDLDNISTKVTALNRFQVYQGNLPPLDVPFGFTAKAQAGGKVRLAWQAVEQAHSYQIYRQAPGEAALSPLTRTGGVEYVDQTPSDGTYRYAIATVRQSNGQESVSGQSTVIEVVTSSTAPGAPQNLKLTLTGQGIYAAWQPPLASAVDYYNLYRASGTSITSIDGLTPLKTRIKLPQTYDTSPSPTQGAYVVTSVDAVGNESAISNSAYLNASLLPVRNLSVEQIDSELPVIRWAAPNGNLAGYLVYVGLDGKQTKLTANPITSTSFMDTGYTAGERRYVIATVDANGVEMPRSVLLPNVAAQIAAGLPIKRGVMNKLQVQVANTSASALEGVRVVVRLPVDRDATQFKDHKSEALALAPNETRLVPVIVGGYAEMPAAPQAQVGVEISPVEGEMVKVTRRQTVAVTEGALVVGMSTDEFTRGATGKLKLTIENITDVDVELLTATGNGANPSTELRFKILDADGNVLATQPYKQVFGANVVTLTNGLTVARIPAGSNYVSDVFLLNVPQASPNSIRVKLEVDKLRYHSGQDDEVQIAGRGSEKTVSLLETAYLGEVTDVSPISSFGDQDVVITGRALDRATKSPLPNTRLKLILNQQGFERTFNVLTDGAGGFAYTFKPTITDAGLYKVSAVHPDITDRPEQKSFTINRIVVGPTPYKLDVPKNYPFTIPLTAQAGPGTTATNLRLTLDAASQPTGQLPEGVDIQLPAPISLTERQRLNLPVLFSARNEAQPSGSLICNVVSDESAGVPLGQVRINYTLSEAKPFIVSTPSFVETGMAQGSSQVESVVVKNNGLQDALNLQFTLSNAAGGAVPTWVSIGSQANGTLAVGQSRSIDLVFSPPAATPEGVYEFKLNVSGENVPSQSLNVYVSLTQSGEGGVLFKASDIYTATVGKDGKLIAGLAGATVTMQNEDVPTISKEMVTDNLGEALFQNVPAGRYKFRARASNHQEVAGRLVIKPGVTVNQALFLDYNLITVEWSVREITIQDRYDITLNATFETDVPAAVVVVQPSSINLPKMASGDVYYGELTMTNYGLVRADNVKQKLPQADAYFRYEFLVDVPASLEAKQRITIPYRVVALQSLEAAAGSGNASGGGCYSYSNTYSVTCDFQCANGSRTSCGGSASWFSVSQSSCASGGGGGVSSGGGGGWGGGGAGGFGGGSASTPIKMKGKKCVFIPKGGMQCEQQ